MSIDDGPVIPASVARLVADDRVGDLGQAVSAFRVFGLPDVALRNAPDEQLRSTWGDWMESADPLVHERARERVARGSETRSHDGARHAFPELRPTRRATAFRMAHRMLVLHNRIAHQVPITHIDIRERLEGTLTLLAWIDPELAAWTWLVTSDPIPSPWGVGREVCPAHRAAGGRHLTVQRAWASALTEGRHTWQPVDG